MALSPGTQIGPYRIVDQIGAGGMGEVYRATDTKLGRSVAIKTLPSALAQEPDRLARFEREAKLLATLNHAHIGAIYGLDEHDGAQFIAMELVEGQTLEEKLKAGALPVEDALQIALQIAEALEAAHEKGVVHRDLKPANIMLTRDGVVKVLDFGLAKAFLGDPNEASPAHSPALSIAMTQQGLILGTAGYMSPEQASGQATDQRADIWAFGVVLYEMLTGLPLFSGESMPHILAAVLQTEPDWSRLPKRLHPRLKLLLERCLKKKVRDRYHSIADARVDIEAILLSPSGAVEPPNVGAPQPLWRYALPASAGALLATAIVGVGAWTIWPPAEAPPVVRFVIGQTEDQPLELGINSPVLALSPDGRYVAYRVRTGRQPAIAIRALDSLVPTVLHECSCYTLFFSPDSAWVAFNDQADGTIKRVAVTGGPALTIGSVGSGRLAGATWGEDDTIVFGTGEPSGLWRLPASGGAVEPLTELDEAERESNHEWPEFLPGGEAVVFAVRRAGDTADAAQIVMRDLETGEQQVLVAGGSYPRYVSSGHLVYAFDGTLRAVPFDRTRRTVTGNPVPVLDGVITRETSGAAEFAVSQAGTLVYINGSDSPVSGPRILTWVDRMGREEPLAADPRTYVKPQLSPDGGTVVLDVRDQQFDLWTWDIARETLSRLTFDPSEDEFPVWSPDGLRIIFSSSRETGSQTDTDLFWRPADGTGFEERLLDGGGQTFPTSFLPDGSGVLIYGTAGGLSGTNDDISVVSLSGDAQVTPLLNTPFAESFPALSPDGKWLAYVSDESGVEEVYVRAFPDMTGRRQISNGGGTQPLWAHSGAELFYRNGDALVAVPIQTEPRFTVGNEQALFDDIYVLPPQGGPNYDVSRDDERFLMIKEFGNPSATQQIIVVQNWLEELNRLLPTD